MDETRGVTSAHDCMGLYVSKLFFERTLKLIFNQGDLIKIPTLHTTNPLYATSINMSKLNLISTPKEIKFEADLKDLSLKDILQNLNDENYFTDQHDDITIKTKNSNYLIVEFPKYRGIPKHIHSIQYFVKSNTISINSRFESQRTPLYLFYIMPLGSILINSQNNQTSDLVIATLIVIGITLFISIASRLTLSETSKEIQRILIIRVKTNLRKKGYNFDL